jgi:hypothetical protein
VAAHGRIQTEIKFLIKMMPVRMLKALQKTKAALGKIQTEIHYWTMLIPVRQ